MDRGKLDKLLDIAHEKNKHAIERSFVDSDYCPQSNKKGTD
jgi:Zn-finger nucleic acid-binding protein